MKTIHQFPMVRLVIPLAGGIFSALSLDNSEYDTRFAAYFIFFIICIWILPFRRKSDYRIRWIFGLLASTCLFCFGYSITRNKYDLSCGNHFSRYCPEYLVARVTDEPVEKANSWKMILEVSTIKEKGVIRPVKGKLLAYLRKSEEKLPPIFNDYLLIHSAPSPIPTPANPGTFDYRRYLRQQGIVMQLSLQPESWEIVGHQEGKSIKGYSLEIRDYLMEVLKQSHIQGREYGVAAALILGQDDILDYETRKDYSSAGVVHILGISGLHVGILYLVANALFSFLRKTRGGWLLRPIIILGIIWFYALITGLSPAALRASAMFTFVMMGDLGKRNSHIINSLATSAFFLLILDPFLLVNIGFQFSYFAVIGIVLAYEALYGWIESRFWLLDKAWSLTAMSLAAQASTLPITLYYFHQFPLYFLPANLLVIPLSNLIIYSGMCVLGSSLLPALSKLFGDLTSFLIRLLNGLAAYIDSLPGSVISGIRVNGFEAFVMYLIIISLGIYLFGKRKHFLLVSLALALALTSGFTVRRIAENRQEKLVVFSVNRHSAVAVIRGPDCTLMADSALLADQKLFDFQVKGGITYLGIKQLSTIPLSETYSVSKSKATVFVCNSLGTFFQESSRRIGWIKSLPRGLRKSGPLRLDVLIISGNPKFNLADLLTYYKPGLIVTDASNSGYRIKKWIEEGKSQNMKLYDARSGGALVLDFSR